MNGSEPTDQTLPGGDAAGDTTAAEPRPYPFLGPPQQIDEIGRIGDYRVIRLLGSGGMGYVFEAEEISLHRRVALKVLKPELAATAENRERFLREARAAAALNSDHAVTIYYVGDGRMPYLAMQFLEGESLQSRLERPDPITLRAALVIARQAAEGLAAAHELGLVHRDIKPANLWLEARTEGTRAAVPEKPGVLRPPPTTLRVKILDFGLARRTVGEPSLTSTGFIVGTPHFMSPEQASGATLDPRADLFSLGCVVYTMLTGELPFPGESALAVMNALANRTPPPVNQKNPAIPAGVADLVTRLLAKDPAQRPGSTREVIAALDALLARLSGDIPLPNLVSAGLGSTQAPRPAAAETPSGSANTSLPPTAAYVPVQTLTTPPRRPRIGWVLLALAAVSLAVAFCFLVLRKDRPAGNPDAGLPPAPDPILVGVLHSQSGTMSVSEKPVIDATILAIEEINAAGGVLGRPLKPVIADGKSDPAEFARQAERLLSEDQVAVIFGCWTSASRKAVRPVVERAGGLLFYPVQYEGLEQSPRIVYLGPAPNQQLLPAVDYLTKTLGKKRLFLVGSDYVFPRAAHEIIKDYVKTLPGVEVVKEAFLPLGSQGVNPVIESIRQGGPDAVINTINGSTNFFFFRELREAGYTAEKLPTLSVSITENEVKGLMPTTLAGNYLAASYFQTIDRPQSREFIRKLKDHYGQDAVATDQMAGAYSGVHLWAAAAEKAGTPDPTAVLAAVRGLEFDGPRAKVKIDPANLHTWLPVHVGRIRPDGLVDVLPGVGSAVPIAPVPFPPTRTPEEWDEFLRALQFGWNGNWQAPDRK